MSKKSEKLKITTGSLQASNRGVNGERLFRSAPDYQEFLTLLLEERARYPVTLQVYALLTADFMLILRQDEVYAISEYLKYVCGKYARRFNKNHHRAGHLFGERYRVEVLDEPGALLRACWLAHNAPVAAGLATDACDWKYSSAREYSGKIANGLTDPREIYSLVGGKEGYLEFHKGFDPTAPESVRDYMKRDCLHTGK